MHIGGILNQILRRVDQIVVILVPSVELWVYLRADDVAGSICSGGDKVHVVRELTKAGRSVRQVTVITRSSHFRQYDCRGIGCIGCKRLHRVAHFNRQHTIVHLRDAETDGIRGVNQSTMQICAIRLFLI